MNFILKTKVNGNYLKVMEGFDRKLFEALKPKGAKMEIIRFTGSKTGDIVELKFLRPIKSTWISTITSHDSDEKQTYFIDEGVQLPFPLKTWKHKHIVEHIDDENSYIIDVISFSSGLKLLDILMYLPLVLSFYPRKRVYRSYFSTFK